MTWKVFVLFYLARAESFVSGKIPFLPSGVAATFIMVAAVAGMDPRAAPPLAAGDWLGATSCLRLPKSPRARRRQAFGHIGQLVADRHLCSFRRRLAAERRAVVRCAPHCLEGRDDDRVQRRRLHDGAGLLVIRLCIITLRPGLAGVFLHLLQDPRERRAGGRHRTDDQSFYCSYRNKI